MLVYCWLKRSVPALLLLVVIACSGGLLKPLFVANSSGRKGSRPLAPSAAESLATAEVAARSGDVANRSEQLGGPRGAAGKVDDWVRTRTGWEHEAKWFATVGRYEPTLHPAVIAALIGLVAVWALVAFPADASRGADEKETPSTSES
jgi:hypothetical protein